MQIKTEEILTVITLKFESEEKATAFLEHYQKNGADAGLLVPEDYIDIGADRVKITFDLTGNDEWQPIDIIREIEQFAEGI